MVIEARLVKKALKSCCRYRVAAVGINRKGEVVGVAFNQPRFPGKGRSKHAEIALMMKFGNRVRTIYICRSGKKGNILPITPCSNCLKQANKLGIRILNIREAKIK